MIVLVREVRVGGLEVRRGRLVVDVSGDSLRVGDLVLRTLRVWEEERSSECCNGSSVMGEFMDSARDLVLTATEMSLLIAFGGSED